MKKATLRKTAQLLFVPLFFSQLHPISAFALSAETYDPKVKSLAVIAYPSSTKDRPFVQEAAGEIRKRLTKIPGLHVVSEEQAQALVTYHADAVKSESTVLSDAEKYLAEAKNHWFDRDYPAALATADAAIKSFKKQKGKGDLLVDALLTKVVILKEMHRHDETKPLFAEALSLNPGLTMEGLPITGRARNVFTQTRKEILERNSGSLEVKTDPPAASVYLNGIKKGVTPLTLKQIPAGSYLLTLEGSHYQTISQPVTVTASTTQFISRKLQWLNGRSRKIKDLGIPVKTAAVVDKEIKMATQIGTALKVDRVILVSSEKKNGEDILITRTIDTTLKASQNPIGVRFADVMRDKEDAYAGLSRDLNSQAKKNVLVHPDKFLDPDTGDVRVLRHKRPFTKSPVFYTLVGIVVGGAIGTAVTLLLDNDDSSSSSSSSGDAGGVDIEFE